MVPPKRPPGGVGEFGGVRGDGGGGFGVKKSNRLAPKDKQNGSTWCLLRHGVALGDFGGIWGVSGWGSGFLAPVLWCEGLPCPKIARFYLLFLQKVGRGGLRGWRVSRARGRQLRTAAPSQRQQLVAAFGVKIRKKLLKWGNPPPLKPQVFSGPVPPRFTPVLGVSPAAGRARGGPRGPVTPIPAGAVRGLTPVGSSPGVLGQKRPRKKKRRKVKKAAKSHVRGRGGGGQGGCPRPAGAQGPTRAVLGGFAGF